MPNSPYQRLLPPDYSDGVSLPRGGLTHSLLPSARAVSVAVHQGQEQASHQAVSLMVMQFGQFLDHDLTLTPEQDRQCCDPSLMGEDGQQPEELRSCFNIDVANDPFYSNKMNCFPFTRSDATCTASGQREQFNLLTAFIDGSNVYGSDEHRAEQLRTLSGGMLK